LLKKIQLYKTNAPKTQKFKNPKKRQTQKIENPPKKTHKKSQKSTKNHKKKHEKTQKNLKKTQKKTRKKAQNSLSAVIFSISRRAEKSESLVAEWAFFSVSRASRTVFFGHFWVFWRDFYAFLGRKLGVLMDF
jgi:hypothetical protein